MSLSAQRHVVLGSIETSLPPIAQKTLRFDFKYDHFDPTTGLADRSDIGATCTHVRGDIYDFTYNNTVWYYSGSQSGGVFNMYAYEQAGSWVYPMSNHSYDIIDSDMTGVTDARYMISSARLVVNCVLKGTGDIVNASHMLCGGNAASTLKTLNALDLHSATDIRSICAYCYSLESPLVITLGGAVTYCTSAFERCYKVPSGALNLYNQLNGQANPPYYDTYCFYECGRDAAQDAPIHAEMQQIPSSWGGSGA